MYKSPRHAVRQGGTFSQLYTGVLARELPVLFNPQSCIVRLVARRNDEMIMNVVLHGPAWAPDPLIKSSENRVVILKRLGKYNHQNVGSDSFIAAVDARCCFPQIFRGRTAPRTQHGRRFCGHTSYCHALVVVVVIVGVVFQTKVALLALIIWRFGLTKRHVTRDPKEHGHDERDSKLLVADEV